jgi:hypothetical protein
VLQKRACEKRPLGAQTRDAGGCILGTVQEGRKGSQLLEKHSTGKVDGTEGAQMGIVGEEQTQLAVGVD